LNDQKVNSKKETMNINFKLEMKSRYFYLMKILMFYQRKKNLKIRKILSEKISLIKMI